MVAPLTGSVTVRTGPVVSMAYVTRMEVPVTFARFVQVATTSYRPSAAKVTPGKVAIPDMAVADTVTGGWAGVATLVTVKTTGRPSSMFVVTAKAA